MDKWTVELHLQAALSEAAHGARPFPTWVTTEIRDLLKKVLDLLPQ